MLHHYIVRKNHSLFTYNLCPPALHLRLLCYSLCLTSTTFSLSSAMGASATVVCAIAAYSYTYTEYGAGLGDFPFAGIVQGGNCSFLLTNFKDDVGDLITLYNITSIGQFQKEDISCAIDAKDGCSTNYAVFDGYPFQSETLEFVATDPSTGATSNPYNLTYFTLPPVPSQPTAPQLLPSLTEVQYQTSLYSSEYGQPLIGCVVAAGVPTYFGAGIPATLSATPAQNSLPYTSSATYAPAQNATVTVSLASMNLAPKTAYDFWVVCYNANGQSAHSANFSITTSATLPAPAPAPVPVSSSSSSAGAAIVSSSAASTGAASSSSSAAAVASTGTSAATAISPSVTSSSSPASPSVTSSTSPASALPSSSSPSSSPSPAASSASSIVPIVVSPSSSAGAGPGNVVNSAASAYMSIVLSSVMAAAAAGVLAVVA